MSWRDEHGSLTFWGSGASSGPADRFGRADAGDLGENWTAWAGGGLSVSDRQAVGGSAAVLADVWTADEFADDQWSQVTVETCDAGAGGGGEFIGPGVRMDTAGNGYVGIYFFNSGTPAVQIYKAVAGSFTRLETAAAPVLEFPFTMRLQVVGTELVLIVNGQALISAYDSTYTAGSAGVTAFDAAAISSFTAGDQPEFAAWFLSTDEATGIETWLGYSNDNLPTTAVRTQTFRVLAPTAPADGQPHRVIIPLPTIANEDASGSFGDGITELAALDAANTYNATIVEPSFAVEPWYADCDGDARFQYESFMAQAFAPYVRRTYGPGELWLVGFSKSGYGGLGLLLRHASVFDRGAFWDFPADQVDYRNDPTGTIDGDGVNYGTDANFQANYRLTTHAASWIDSEDFGDTRVWIGGFAVFETDIADCDALLTGLGVEHLVETPTERAHLWTSGWLSDALDGLASSLP